MRDFVGGLILVLAIVALLYGVMFLASAIDQGRDRPDLRTASATIAVGLFVFGGCMILTIIMGHLNEISKTNEEIVALLRRQAAKREQVSGPD